MQEPDTQYRAIAFDCLGDQQEGLNRTDWKRRPRYNLDSEGGFHEVVGTPTSHKGQNIHSLQRTNLFGKRPKGTDRKRWRLKCHKLALLGQGPVDTPDRELSEEIRPLMPEPLVQLQVEEMNARYKISELQLAETKALDEFQEASAKLTQIYSTDGQDVVPNEGTPTGPNLKAKTEPADWMVRSFAEVTKHGPSPDKHERSCEKVSQWRTKVVPILREPPPVMGSDLAPPTALFQNKECSVRSVIEANGELLGQLATELRNRIYEDFADSVFDPTGNESAKIEANAFKRGPKDVSFCKLELKPGSQPRACNPIRAVGIKEEEMNKKIKGFLAKGWIVRSHNAWVVRGFLVPKPGTNKWRLVIDYRYLNLCLEGHEFPLPVIEDLLQGQAGNHLWGLLDLEDGFQQMPLLEECRHFTAFCTPAVTFEWKVLPMGVKVGPQAFQRLVSWCVGRLKPHIIAYIDDILVGTRPTCSGKGKLLDSQAKTENYKLVRELFEVLKECHLQVKKGKCSLFYT